MYRVQKDIVQGLSRHLTGFNNESSPAEADMASFINTVLPYVAAVTTVLTFYLLACPFDVVDPPAAWPPNGLGHRPPWMSLA